MLIFLEYLAFAGALISVWFYASNARLGAAVGACSSIGFIFWGIGSDVFMSWFTGFIFFGMHIRNFINSGD